MNNKNTKPNIYRDIDEEFDKEFLDEFGDIRPKARPYEVKDFIHKQIDKAVMETEVKTGLANFKVCREEIDRAIDKNNREWEKNIKKLKFMMFGDEKDINYIINKSRIVDEDISNGFINILDFINNLLKHKE